MVFRNKLDEDGIVTRNKARMVVQGYNQEKGIDYDETFDAVARLEAIRLLIAFATHMKFTLHQMIVKSAFLNGYLKEEVFVKQPPGFESKECSEHVYKLDKVVILNLVGYVDADYGGFLGDRKSTPGMAHFLGSCLVSWATKKQNLVALSTVEAEYIAAASCCAQLLWIKHQLVDFGIKFGCIPIFCDNASAIKFCATDKQIADIFTKELSREYFERNSLELGTIKIT
ncbi:uncharacterized protein [Nicotiana sylvestris]|uniref:uncharacterized protein n=1 Tax=Nicotiana sylvestris TaxID=4096 RepID=UPI00388CBB8A